MKETKNLIALSLSLGASPEELGLYPYQLELINHPTRTAIDKRPKRVVILSTPLHRDESPFMNWNKEKSDADS